MTTTPDQDRLVRIRTLNDKLRQNFAVAPHRVPGRFKVLLTPGCHTLSDTGLGQLIQAVRMFTAFTTDNDPHGEHDFGAVTIADTRFFWKIDYYDRDMAHGSADPADPASPSGC